MNATTVHRTAGTGTGAVQIGRPEHAALNSLLTQKLSQLGTLVVAHRGTAVGSIAENTIAAAMAALSSGADVVEIDATESADGAFYAFHDGIEQLLLGTSANLGTLTAQEIDTLRYLNVDRRLRPSPVEPLLSLLAELRSPGGGTSAPLVNVDRSWASWRTLLPALDELDMAGQLLLKSPVSLPEPLEVLRRHGVKYPYLPICTSPSQLEGILADPDLNTVGVELLADTPEHPFAAPGFIADLQQRGLCVLVNAEVLPNDRPLFAGYDDELALRRGPALGWGPLFDLGADLIQTDWPWLLRDYRRARRDAGAAPGAPSQIPGGRS